MSSLRGCGKCGGIFSENEEDWSTFNGTQSRRDKATGRKFTETVEDDQCPQCTRGEPPLPNRPRLPLIGAYGNQPAPAIAMLDTKPMDHDLHTRMADAERTEILDRLAALEQDKT